MQYDILGKSGLKISVIGFGGIPIQRVTEEEAIKVVKFALDNGINFIDTARGYSVSEGYIGKAIKDCRQDVVLATKGPGLTKEAFGQNIEQSLTTMDTPYIDLYQVHNVKDCDAIDVVFGVDGAYDAFVDYKNKGKVLHFGLTCHKREVLEYALKRYGDKVESIMFPYNIVENQGEDLFQMAHDQNIGVIVMKPLAGGNLTDANLALRYCLANPNVTVVIPGMASDQEILQNVSAQKSPLTKEEKAKCDDLVKELGNEFCRRCGYCAPCSVGIDIPTCFTFRNYLKNYDLASWASERYQSMKVTAEACIECGKCMERCPYELDIISKLKEVARDFADYKNNQNK